MSPSDRKPAPRAHTLRELLLLSDFARANPRRAQELLDAATRRQEPVDAA